MSPCGICGSLSHRERVGVREHDSTLAIAPMERFVEIAKWMTGSAATVRSVTNATA
jgi:hypothetical protein